MSTVSKNDVSLKSLALNNTTLLLYNVILHYIPVPPIFVNRHDKEIEILSRR